MPHPFDIFCENHPEREAVNRISLPSIGIGTKRFYCDECSKKMEQAFASLPPEPRRGRTYKQVCLGSYPGTDRPYYEQVEE